MIKRNPVDVGNPDIQSLGSALRAKFTVSLTPKEYEDLFAMENRLVSSPGWWTDYSTHFEGTQAKSWLDRTIEKTVEKPRRSGSTRGHGWLLRPTEAEKLICSLDTSKVGPWVDVWPLYHKLFSRLGTQILIPSYFYRSRQFTVSHKNERIEKPIYEDHVQQFTEKSIHTIVTELIVQL